MKPIQAFASVVLTLFAVCTLGGCSYVVEFDRSLLLDGGTDGEAEAESQAASDDGSMEAEAAEAPVAGPDGG